MMLVGAILAAAMTSEWRRPGGLRETNAKALAARYFPDGACIAAMLAGMILGGWVGPSVIASLGVASNSTRLISAMVVGMIVGMAITMPLYRERFCRDSAAGQPAP